MKCFLRHIEIKLYRYFARLNILQHFMFFIIKVNKELPIRSLVIFLHQLVKKFKVSNFGHYYVRIYLLNVLLNFMNLLLLGRLVLIVQALLLGQCSLGLDNNILEPSFFIHFMLVFKLNEISLCELFLR